HLNVSQSNMLLQVRQLGDRRSYRRNNFQSYLGPCSQFVAEPVLEFGPFITLPLTTCTILPPSISLNSCPRHSTSRPTRLDIQIAKLKKSLRGSSQKCVRRPRSRSQCTPTTQPMIIRSTRLTPNIRRLHTEPPLASR